MKALSSSQKRPKSKPAVYASRFVVFRLFTCIAMAGLTLYFYIDKQNELTELRLAIPTLAKEVRRIQDENVRLHYEIERFESPVHLIELLHKPEFSHLKFPYISDEIFLPKAPSTFSSILEGDVDDR